MIKLVNLLIEQITEQYVYNYEDMNEDDLWTRYNDLQLQLQSHQERADLLPNTAVEQAWRFLDSGVDVTRPMWSSEVGTSRKVWIPGLKKKVSYNDYRNIVDMIENAQGEEKTALENKYGLEYDIKSGKTVYTTDNTCAQTVCMAYDMAASEANDFQHDLFFRPTGRDFDLENDHIKGKGSYRSKAHSIYEASLENTHNWTHFDSTDFEGDPRSVEWWEANIRPGDIIMYYTGDWEEGKTKGDHVAMALDEPLALFQDGSSKYSPTQRYSMDDHTNTHAGKNFKIIRYDNNEAINNTTQELASLENEISNRDAFAHANFIGPKQTTTDQEVVVTDEPQQAGPGGIITNLVNKITNRNK